MVRGKFNYEVNVELMPYLYSMPLQFGIDNASLFICFDIHYVYQSVAVCSGVLEVTGESEIHRYTIELTHCML